MNTGSQARTSEPTRVRGNRAAELHGNLRFSLIDGTAYSVMVGVAELYLPAFLLALSKNQIASGLITTIPVLLGCVVQLVSPWMVRRLASNKRWVVIAAAGQSLSLVPLAAAAFVPGFPIGLLFLLATVYWTFGQSTGAAWTSWIGTVVPQRIRAHYFGYRNRWCQGGTLAGLVIGGVILQQADRTELALRGFAALFVLGGLCRGVSSWYLWLQTERLPLDHVPSPVSLGSALRTFGGSSTGRLFTFMCASQVATQAALPFLSPFLLAQLHVSYETYMLLIGAAYAGRMIALPTLGKLARRYGEGRVMVWAALAFVPLPLGWMVSHGDATSLAILLVTQLLFGVLMAAWELSTFLLLFESIPDSERTRALAAFYVAQSSSMSVGSMMGGALIAPLMGRVGGVHAYWVVFGLAIVLRLAAVPLALRAGRGGRSRVEPAAEAILQDAKS